MIWIVLDGVGAGCLPDASQYGDEGSDTLGNLSKQRPLHLPELGKLGIGNLTPINGTPPIAVGSGEGASGRAEEKSLGKDTTTGHWEMTGLTVTKPFKTFPNGFSDEAISKWTSENQLPGVLGNKAASGTEIIKELGEEHVKTGKPILYTSADSVWQVAAHEEAFGLQRLYDVCVSARKICDELQIGRVIARPFVGENAQSFQRTYNRKDYAQPPFQETFLDLLCKDGIATLGVGKISNIFAAQGIQKNIDTKGNTDGLQTMVRLMSECENGLIFCNLIDTDMLYGHRRDVEGYARAMEEIDRAIGEIKKQMTADDFLILASDHGNDPTFKGTDHTREYIPVIAYTPAQTKPGPVDLGVLSSFADVGATVYDALTSKNAGSTLAGKSFLPEMGLAS